MASSTCTYTSEKVAESSDSYLRCSGIVWGELEGKNTEMPVRDSSIASEAFLASSSLEEAIGPV